MQHPSFRFAALATLLLLLVLSQLARSTSPAADALTSRQQAIVTIAALTAKGDLPRLHTALDKGLQAGEGGKDARVKELAVRNLGDGVRGAGVEADQDPGLGAAGRKRGAAAGVGGRGHQWQEFGSEALACESGFDDMLFPLGHEGVRGVLQLAAAARAGVAAGGFDAVG